MPTSQLFAISLLGLAVAGCAPRTRLCADSAPCARGACVAGRCEGPGVPDLSKTHRTIVMARAMALAMGTPRDLETTFSLGGARDGEHLLLSFDSPVLASGRIVEAYLVLSMGPMQGGLEPAGELTIDVRRIVDPWSPVGMSRARVPHSVATAVPSRRLRPRTESMAVVRLDVASLVAENRRRGQTKLDVAVVGSGDGSAIFVGAGATLASDVGQAGLPPLLEIYATPEEP
jgi:hypothetical protein